jgi:hypothetical protein
LHLVAFLFAFNILTNCSELPVADSSQPAEIPNYGQIISQYVRGGWLQTKSSNVEISNPRWIHAMTGWNWLVCVRFQDGQVRRTYSFFIANNAVTNARFDVLTDSCGLQTYSPFDLSTGNGTAPTLQGLSPIY